MLKQKINILGDLHTRIDATLLKPDVPLKDYKECIETATRLQCRGLIVPQSMYKIFPYELDSARASGVILGTVIGFPFGNESVLSKLLVKSLYQNLQIECDVVLNWSLMKAGRWHVLEEEILDLLGCFNNVKFIVEAPQLTTDELKKITNLIAVLANSHQTNKIFLKTATGYFGSTTLDHAKVIREVLGDQSMIELKISGGIRSLEHIQDFDQYDVSVYGIGFPYFQDIIIESQRKALLL